MSEESRLARWPAVRRQFEALLDLPAAEREARLAEIAATDPSLAAELVELLALEADADGTPLDHAIAAEAARVVAGEEPTSPFSPLAGVAIGAWRLTEPLGRGGMAEVWAAERIDREFELRVAVKLLKRGMDSAEVVARFARERRILARLDHPAIARILDGGLAPDGRPYLVLERVDGGTITEWCNARELDLRQRITLFLEALEAVAAAHRQLVVHRDLKPSNILVTAEGRVRLLDFGIAKLLADDDPEMDATRTELRLLTPAYAAPEQILGEPISTATDVYALGVLAHELFTGRLPYRRQGRRLAELATSAANETLPRPSTAVLAAASGGEPALGLPEPRRLARALRGDLDAILATALRREPSRRYASVAAFAEDLRRHLSGLPVSARPDSLLYRAGRFVKRHRVAVAAVAVAAIGLLVASAVALREARRATLEAERSRLAAEHASREARRAERVQEFLVGLFEKADPRQGGGSTVSAGDLLARGAAKIEGELASEPALQADLLDAVARSQANLGLLEEAEKQARKALALRGGHDDGASLAVLGAVLRDRGQLDESAATLRRAVTALDAAGTEHALAAARARSELSYTRYLQGSVQEAADLLAEVYPIFVSALGEDDPETAEQLMNRGIVLGDLNRLDEAFALESRAQEVLARRLGTDHPAVANGKLSLAAICEETGRQEQAERLYRESLATRLRVLGADHPETGQSHSNLARFLISRHRPVEGEPHAREAIRIFRAVDPQHFEVAKSIHDLASAALQRGHLVEAERDYREAMRRFLGALGPGHPFPWIAQVGLGDTLAAQGRRDEARRALEEAARKIEAASGPEGWYLMRAWGALANLERSAGHVARAVELRRRALALARKALGEKAPATALLLYELALDLEATGAVEARAEAAQAATTALAILRAKDPQHWRLADVTAAATRLATAAPARVGGR